MRFIRPLGDVILLTPILDQICDASRTKRRARRSTKVGGLVWETPAWTRRGGGEVAGFGVCGVDQNPISARCGGHRVGGLVPSAPALSEVMAPRRVSGRVFNSPQRSENYWTRVRYPAEGTPTISLGRLTARLAGRPRAASRDRGLRLPRARPARSRGDAQVGRHAPWRPQATTRERRQLR